MYNWFYVYTFGVLFMNIYMSENTFNTNGIFVVNI